MSFLKTLLLSVVLVALLLNGIRAFYKETDTCVFTQIGKSSCIGPGTSEVADYVRLFLGTGENYAVGWHPCGLILLAKVNVVGATSLVQKLRINGIYAYINKVDGAFYYFPTIGCEKPHLLCDNDDYLPGLIDLTNRQLLKIVIHLTNGYPYDTACNTLPFKTLIGPSPNAPEDFPGANMYFDISGMQSAHIIANNCTGSELAKKYFGCASKPGISITSDRDTVILSEARCPVVRKCKRKKFDLVDPTKGKYPEISALKSNSACFWSTLVAEQLTALIVDRLIYVFWAVSKSDNSGVLYYEGYTPALSIDYTFDPLYYSYC